MENGGASLRGKVSALFKVAGVEGYIRESSLMYVAPLGPARQTVVGCGVTALAPFDMGLGIGFNPNDAVPGGTKILSICECAALSYAVDANAGSGAFFNAEGRREVRQSDQHQTSRRPVCLR
jgi:hypothetical protein